MRVLALVFLISAVCLPLSAQFQSNVSGNAEVRVVPDRAIISLGVEVHSKTLAEARRDNDNRIRAVRAAVTAMGIDDKDIQTDFIQMGMQYENDGITPRFYYARKSVVLTLRDINKMESVVAGAVDAGATHIHGVDFQTTRLRELRDQARALAVKAAMEKAKDMAAAAGMQVVGSPRAITSVDYGGGSSYGRGWGGFNGNQMSQNVSFALNSSAGAGDTIAVGMISVTATVSMQFNIQ